MAHVFISYSNKDRSFALQLQKDLQLNGIDSWIDDRELVVGDRLNQQILQALGRARWVIVLLSRHSIHSKWVRKETLAALLQHMQHNADAPNVPLPLIPAVIEEYSYAAFMRNVQTQAGLSPDELLHADFVTDYNRALEQVVKRIVQAQPRSGGRSDVNAHPEGNGDNAQDVEAAELLGLDELVAELPSQLEQPEDRVILPLVCIGQSGKTRLLKELGRAHPDATYLDLKQFRDMNELHNALKSIFVTVLLLDNVRDALLDDAQFFGCCNHLIEQGRKLVIALHPGSYRDFCNGLRSSPRGLDDPFCLLGIPKDTAQALVCQKLSESAVVEVALKLIKMQDRWPPIVLDQLIGELRTRPPNDMRRINNELGPLQEDSLRRLLGEITSKYNSEILRRLDKVQRRILRGIVHLGTSYRPHKEHSNDIDLLVKTGVLSRLESNVPIADTVLASYFDPPLVIHHMADLHAHGYKQDEAAYIRYYINEVLSDDDRAPHLIVISGDLSETSDRDWEYVKECFKAAHHRLAKRSPPAIPADSPRILIVGGNHDVNWEARLGEENRHDHLKELADAVPVLSPYIRKDGSSFFCRITFGENRPFPLEFLLIDSTMFGQDQGVNPTLLEWLENQRVEMVKSHSPEARADLLKTLVANEPGYVEGKALDAISALQQDDDRCIRIAILHHPLSPIPSRFDGHYASLINAGRVKEKLFEKRTGLVLHGHMHTPWLGKEAWPETGDWTMRILAAPALGSDLQNTSPGFNEIRLLRENNCPLMLLRRFRHRGSSWDRDGQLLEFFEPGCWQSEQDAPGIVG